MPVSFFTANVQLVKCISYFVLLVPIFRLTSNSWLSNWRAAGLCYAARGHICKLCD